MWHKFKIILVALLLCYLPQASAINILFGEGNPICLEAINRMDQDPHFFERASKEQYHYILLDSPFKRDYFEYVPMDIAYPLFLQQEAIYLKGKIRFTELNKNVNKSGYYLLDEDGFSEMEFKTTFYDNMNTAGYAASTYYDYYLGENGFAYKTNISFSDKLYIIGFVADILNFSIYDKWSSPVEYFIVDEDMQIQPIVLEQYYNPDKKYYSMRYSPPNRLNYFYRKATFVGVPIDIMGETLAMQIYQGWKFSLVIFRNVYDDGDVWLEPICEFSKDVH